MDDVIILDDALYDSIVHTGTPHEGSVPHSGRYKWGSGDAPYQHQASVSGFINDLKKDNPTATDREIADMAGFRTVQEMRNYISIERAESRKVLEDYAQKMLRDNPEISKREIGERAYKEGLYPKVANESTVRGWLNPVYSEKNQVLKNTADTIKKACDDQGIIQIGYGVESELGITSNKLSAAIDILKYEGYNKYSLKVEQLGTGFKTTIDVMAPPGMTKSEAGRLLKEGKLGTIKDYDTGSVGDSLALQRATPISLDRVLIKYAEDGGSEKDGVIELRRNVPELELGNNSNYAQVRINVDDKYYMKGIALYSDHIPEGYDVIFNSSKHKSGGPAKALKPLYTLKNSDQIDWNNPFKSAIKMNYIDENGLLAGGQHEYIDSEGNKKLSAINKVNEEGDWSRWSKSLAAQFLSKQDIPLIRKQLDKTIDQVNEEYEEIMSVTNPTLRKQYLLEFASNCDSRAVKLKSVGLPYQTSKLILPVPGLKDNEIYAPDYNNGDVVCLVRYPHAGTFEIPVLTVNNRNKEAISVLGKHPIDAVGIAHAAAEHLSGADFDGDTVICLKTYDAKKDMKIADITAKPYLASMRGFDTKEAYPPVYDDKGNIISKVMPESQKQKQMGMITNLITDVTASTDIKPTEDELACLVKHSMVVVDAYKHKLDYTRSYKENNIAEIQKKFRGSTGSNGAATIFSRSKSVEYIDRQSGYFNIDPETGKQINKTSKETRKDYVFDENGKIVDYIDTGEHYKQKAAKMALTDDARTLMSGANHEGTPKEQIYADFANKLKAIANQARLDYITTEDAKKSVSATQVFEKEVASILEKNALANSNRPRERQAQAYANAYVRQIKRDTNQIENKEDEKKIRNQALSLARLKFGAKREKIVFTDKEWEAINSNAFGKTVLTEIFSNCDKDQLKARAMPKSNSIKLSESDIVLIRSLSGRYTIAEIADKFDVSSSTISKVLKS